MISLYQCMQEESNAIMEAAKKLKNNDVDKIINLFDKSFENKKKILLTGVGKSGIVARKLAATFTSIGFTAIYLNPLDALHGDLGIVNQDDLCIFISNSGETNELIQLLPHLKNKGSIQIGILGKKDSTLGNSSDVSLDAGVDKEVCPLNLAPTASTTVAMAIGDALAVVWMSKSGISKNDFAINHPSGRLGRKLTLRVSDLMKKRNQFNILPEDSSFLEIITELTRGGMGICCIKNKFADNELGGLITDGDLRRTLRKYSPSDWEYLIAREFMTKDPIVISPNSFAIEALKLMEENRKKPITILPVIGDDSRFLGILKLHDLIQAGLSE